MANTICSTHVSSESRTRCSVFLLFVLLCTLVLSSVASAQDSDGQLLAAVGVAEPVNLASTVNAAGSAVDVFDFRLLDGATADGLALNISQIVLHTSGTATSTVYNQVVWRLSGPDASNVTGTYSSGGNTITFSGLTISVSNGGLETYVVNAYYATNSGLTEGQTFVLSLDGDVDLTLGAGTLMSGGNGTISNSTGSPVVVAATQLVFTTQPSGSVSGSALTTQPIVAAQDAAGNTDTDFAETVTVTESAAGSLSNAAVTASSGVATFANLSYTATVDGESFTLTANDQDGVGTDLPTVNASAVSSDVVATQLVFTTQPAPLALTSGTALDFSTDPIVEARDANGIKDTGFTDTVTLTETGAGTATYSNNSIAAVAGIATFTGMTMTYTAAAHGETFSLQADDTGAGSEGDISTLPSSSSFTAQAIDSDAILVAATGVSEPIALPSTANSASAAVNIFDFKLSDGGTADGLNLSITQIVLHTSGTGPFSQLVFLLNGPDASSVTAAYSSSANTLTFSSLGIVVANGSNETYTVSAYYATNSGLTENQTFALSIDGDTDLTVSSAGTQMSGANAALSNGTGSTVAITATQLVLTTAPADTRVVDSSDEVLSGSAFLTQPIVTARDAALNIDADFVDVVQASISSGGGALAGTTSATAVAGTATFGGLRYDASVDGEVFILSFDDQSSGAEGDLNAVVTASLSADIVATQWVFSRQPSGAYAGLALATQPQVEARDALGKVDSDISLSASLAISPAGSLANATATSSSGVASFSGLIATGVGTQRTLIVSGGSLSSSSSAAFDVLQAQGSVVFQGLNTVVFDGNPKTRISAVSPSGLTVSTTYNGSPTPPTAPGTYQVVATIVDAVYAGSATTELKILPPAAPVAGLRAEPSEGAVPLKVKFSNTSEGFGYTFLETFNDAGQTFDDLTSVEVLYETPGVYEAVLTIKGQGGQGQVRVAIVVHGPPQLRAGELRAEGTVGDALTLSLATVDNAPGNWSVAAVDSSLIARVEIEHDKVRAVPVAGASGTAHIELVCTNAWGLSSRLKAVLEWLPISLGQTGEGSAEHSVGEETADSTGLAAAGGNEAIADTAGGGASSLGDSTVAVANGSAGTVTDTVADSTATAMDGDITAKTGADSSASIAGDSTVVDSATGATKPPVAGSATGVPPLDVPAGSSGAPAAGAASGAAPVAPDGLPAPAYVDVQGHPVRGLFNEDMVVNLDDFLLFSSHFGMASGRDGFDPHFDLDQNGVINLADFFIFADNFGREAVAAF
jgi:PKD repeat protein